MTKIILALMTFGFIGTAQADFGEISIMVEEAVLKTLEKPKTNEEYEKVKPISNWEEAKGVCADYDNQVYATYDDSNYCIVCFENPENPKPKKTVCI